MPPVGTYNFDNHTIEKRVRKEEEDDEDLIIERPGFGVKAERFKQVIKEKSKKIFMNFSR
jgi:hypothetical protein